MSGSWFNKPSTPKMYQADKQKQNMIVDQNYSNNIMMMIMSTLESLAAAMNSKSVKREDKMYGHYDKVNYDNKNFIELKSQLRVHLNIFKASKDCFEKDHSFGKHTLPE
jgi:hypothetical protein